MPPLPPVTDVIKASLNWQLDDNLTAESILHFQYSGGAPSSSDCSALGADIQASAVTNLKALLSTVNKIGPCVVLDLGSSTGAQGLGGTATAGTRSGNGNPASTSVVMGHHIARRYRGGKPRTYLPILNSADLASTGTWQSSVLTTVGTDWAAFITTALAATSGSTTLTNFVNVSYFHGGTLRTTPVVDTISASTPRPRIGTQRRRNKTA